MKVAIIQLNSQNDKESNLSQAEKWIEQACETNKPDLIALPEMFHFMGGTIEQKKAAAEDISGKSEAVALLMRLALKYKVFIHSGSICEYFSGKYYNTTCVINSQGKLIGHYRKINLFKFTTQNDQYDEASFLTPGDKVVTYQIGTTTIGCAICFDLRFGNLFQELIKKKVDVIVVPSAFTYETGKAHWEILCRSRAMETQTYLIAPAQTGNHRVNNQTRDCWGHSLAADGWGNIIADLGTDPGFMCVDLDFDNLKSIRARLTLLPSI
ncbi:MAG: carbon-nitrogen hydrolase family protein [Gammaproteobacteria bacterium]|nr:carbon-nitrogen hydrolase family protein [Gammaproteobacteria bacterium]